MLQTQIVRRDSCRLTIDQWRSDRGMVKLASKIMSNPDFQLMIDVLRTHHIVNYSLMLNPTMEQRAFQQAKGEGYSLCLSNLESMAQYSIPESELIEDFQPETPPQDLSASGKSDIETMPSDSIEWGIDGGAVKPPTP